MRTTSALTPVSLTPPCYILTVCNGAGQLWPGLFLTSDLTVVGQPSSSTGPSTKSRIPASTVKMIGRP